MSNWSNTNLLIIDVLPTDQSPNSDTCSSSFSSNDISKHQLPMLAVLWRAWWNKTFLSATGFTRDSICKWRHYQRSPGSYIAIGQWLSRRLWLMLQANWNKLYCRAVAILLMLLVVTITGIDICIISKQKHTVTYITATLVPLHSHTLLQRSAKFSLFLLLFIALNIVMNTTLLIHFWISASMSKKLYQYLSYI